MPAKPQPTTAVVGLGASGMSALNYLNATDSLVVIDSRTEPGNLALAKNSFPQARFYVGRDSQRPERWTGVGRVVVSPGVAANDALLEGSEALPRLSDIDLFLASTDAPVIGITGTNGKSTVTALLGHICNELGVVAQVGGNLGEPALNLLRDDVQLYVLELSSFQIEHSGRLTLAGATVLNVTPDHLDRHGDLSSYGAIKRRIYANAEFSVSNADDAATLPENPVSGAESFGHSAGADWQLLSSNQAGQHEQKLAYRGVVFAHADDFSLQGRHNLMNLLAAFALAAALELPQLPPFIGNEPRYVEAASGFAGLAHRAELVAELHGVRYINDSKATNVGACIAALDGFSATPCVVLIAGGQGKGADFSPLAEAVARCVRVALLIGEDADLIQRAIGDSVPTRRCADLSAAVTLARELAQRGDTVLLAPACASFDQFDSFYARGDAFARFVGALV